MFRTWAKLTVALLSVAIMGSVGGREAHAQPAFRSGELYFVHGLPGDDLDDDMTDFPNSLPVDVRIGPAGALNTVFANVPFGSFRGPLTLTQGVYQIEISLANLMDPGSNPPVPGLTGTVSIRPQQSFTFVAHLDTNGAPKGTAFANATERIPLTQSRVVARNAANIGPVDIALTSTIGFPGAATLGLANSTQSGPTDLMAGPYLVRFSPAGQPGTNLVTPLPLSLSPLNAQYLYLVGSTENGTLQVLVQRLPLKRKLLP